MTATKPDPLTLEEAAQSLPLFSVGQIVRVWYMGLLGPDEHLARAAERVALYLSCPFLGQARFSFSITL